MEGGVVDLVAVDGPEEVGDAQERRLALPGEPEPGALRRARLVVPDDELVAVAGGGEVAVHDLRHEDAGGRRLGQLVPQDRADALLEGGVVLVLPSALARAGSPTGCGTARSR